MLPGNIQSQVPGAGQGTKLCHLLADEALLRRLAGTQSSSEDCVSALRSLNLPDSFWTDEFKVVPCAKTYSHKWTLCPCAHIGETARRRCPRTVNYKAVLCPLVKAKKPCPLGDSCSYAHNVFEHWLHPSRYKTRLCSFGRNCNRSICFFAHSAEELRCVPMGDDEKADESGYLMQLLMAQESGLLSPAAAAAAGLQPAPMVHQQPAAPQPLMPGLMPDLGSALQHALQCPLPPSNRPSMSGLPDAPPLLPGRASISGITDFMPATPSLSGVQDAAVMAARASLSGVPENGPPVLGARSSFSGVPDGPSAGMGGLGGGGYILQGRHSVNGLMDGAGGMMRGRASANGLPDPARMLMSMSARSMQHALSGELNAPLHTAAMHRALSSDLNGSLHHHHSLHMHMQRAMSSDLVAGGAQQAAAVAAAAASAAAFAGGGSAAAAAQVAAMERRLSRELSGATSPLQSAAAALERAYSSRDGVGGAVGGGLSYPLERALTGSSSRSLGSSASRDLGLGHTTSVHSVESDSLVNMCGGGLAGLGHIGGGALGGGGFGGLGHAGLGGGFAGVAFELGNDAKGPTRLSDPGGNFASHYGGFQHQQAAQQQQQAQQHAAAAAEAGGTLGGLLGKDLCGLESLLPLVNNALAAGALSLPAPAVPRRSSSGANGNANGNGNGASLLRADSSRVMSPPLQCDGGGGGASGSPTFSGTLTPPSPSYMAAAAAAAAGGERAGAGDGAVAPPSQRGLRSAGQASPLPHVMPGGEPSAAEQEAEMRAAAAAGAAGGAVDQAYLNDLMARMQDQGVNKEQLVSSLSQLLAQLLSVGN